MIALSLTLNYLGSPLPQSPDTVNTIVGSGPGKTLRAKAGVNNTIISGGGGSILYGGGASDTFYVSDLKDQVIVAAGSGIDTIVSWTSYYALPANVENLTLQSGSGGIGVGNSLDNLLVAQGGSDYTLVGGGGNDVLIGNGSGSPADTGAGSTRFVIAQGDGNDVIANFRSGIDVVQLTGFTSLTSFAQVKAAMTQVGANTVLNLGDGHTLTFGNKTPSQFVAQDFKLPAYLPNMTLRFSDDFNNFVSSPDGSRGWRTTGATGWRTLSGNNEDQYYSDSSVGVNPFSVNSGVLTITATQGSNPLGLKYNSGVITSNELFSFQYGLIEVSAKLPAGDGLWPAIWLGATNLSWPPEIDIMEMLGNDPTSIYVGTHSAVGGPNVGTTTKVYVGDTTNAFHTYGLDWEPDRIRWFFDGTEIFSEATPADLKQPLYLLLNLAVGGANSWPGAPSSPSEFPAKFQIDSVKVYASPNTVKVGGPGALAPGAPVTIIGASEVPASAPVVTGITTNPNSGSFGYAGVIKLTVNFSQAVTVAGGTPLLLLNDGGTATYVSGSGTTALLFSYTVGGGQNTADLAAKSSGALVLNGATLRNASAANAILSGADGVNPTGTLQVDTISPTIASIVTTPGSGYLVKGAVVKLTVNFSEAVNVAGGTPTLLLNDGGVATYQSGSGTSALVFSYTVATGQNTGDLALAATGALALNGATISDGARNNAVLTVANAYNPTGILEIDTGAPSITVITVTPGSGTLTVGGKVTLTVTFNDFVTVAGGTPTLKLNDGGTATYVSGSGTKALAFSYTVGAGQNTADLALAASGAFALNGATLRDTDGNDAALTSANGYGPAGTLKIDTSAPSAVSVTAAPGAGTVTAGGTVTLAVNFNDVVTVANGTPTLKLNDGGTATYLSGSGTVALVFRYTVGVGETTPDLALAASGALVLNGATIRDAAGNNASLSGINGYNPAGILQIGAAKPSTTLTVAGWWQDYEPGAGVYTVSGAAGGAQITLQDGNQTVNVTGTNNTITAGDGNSVVTLIGDNNTVLLGDGANTINLTGSYETVTVGATPSGTTTISAIGFGQTVTSTGAGDIRLSGPTGNSTVNLADGDHTVTIGGSGNTVTVGVGTSTINAGIGQGVVHAGGGAATITVTGWNNVLDAGPGNNVLNGGNGHDTFFLNGPNEGKTVITGFKPTIHDVLNLSRTLASAQTKVDLTNVSSFITAAPSGGSTTLYVDPTGGRGTPYAFAVLSGVTTNVSELLAQNDLRLS